MRDWREYAACQGIPTELFYYEQSDRDAGFADASFEIKKLCGKCPVRRYCLSAALRMEQDNHTTRHGIWGGLTPNGRKALWNSLIARREVDLCARNLHEMSEDNVYVNPQGSQECRGCKRLARRRYSGRQKIG